MSQQLNLPLRTAAELTAEQNAAVFEDANEMMARCPALFATTAHPKMSERYSFTNTYDIVLMMHNRGYRVTSVSGGEQKFGKVMVRMRNTNYFDGAMPFAPEVLVLDSHDGSRRLKAMLGAIKFACMNGVIAGDFIYARSYLHYSRDLMSQIRLDMEDIDQHTDKLIQRIAKMREHKTTLAERMLLADTAVKQRYGEDRDGAFVADVRQKMLNVRREEDNDNDLFTAMNVVQENILRGGGYYTVNNRVQHMRPITQVDRNVHINQALWQCAEDIMKKAA